MLSRVELYPSRSRVLSLTCLPFNCHCYCAIVAVKVRVTWNTLWWPHLFPTLVMQFSISTTVLLRPGGSPDPRIRTKKEWCVVRSTTTRSRSQINGTFGLDIGQLWPLYLSSHCGDETLGIRVNLRYMYSSAVLQRLRCPVVIGNRVRYFNRAKLGWLSVHRVSD